MSAQAEALTVPPPSPDWRRRAACRRSKISFVTDDPVEIDRARAVCAGCGVRDRCLEDALSRDEPYGIWGGLTPEERGVRVFAQQNRPRCVACDGALVSISDTRSRCLACGSVWLS